MIIVSGADMAALCRALATLAESKSEAVDLPRREPPALSDIAIKKEVPRAREKQHFPRSPKFVGKGRRR